MSEAVPSVAFDDLQQRISALRVVDSSRLRNRLRSAVRLPNVKQADEIDAIRAAISRAEEALARRSERIPAVSLPADLPITERADEIVELFRAHQVVVVAGETGSGKSTQLPKLCLAAGRGRRGLIGHTQPRRIAARSVAERVAEELGSRVGETVGYSVRFTDRTSERTFIRVMTDGILLAEIARDPMLLAYDTIIIDEAHERSLNIDFLLGFFHRLLPKRPDLLIVITSATIDTERIASHFGGAPILEVSGRTYPVEVRYRPLDESGVEEDDLDLDTDQSPQVRAKSDSTPGRGRGGASTTEGRDQNQAIVDAVHELIHEGPGDILVFLSGEREIRDAAEALENAEIRSLEIVPLFARLSAEEQHRVFAAHTGRRVVLATNVAETSLTVPGIRSVIDTGVARISRYSKRTKVQRLPIERISKASANQRAGRCGRLGPGVCIRLYSEEDFAARPDFTEPEIQRTNLASVVLQMAAMRVGDISAFPFVDPPDLRSVRDGVALLEELGAVDPNAVGSPKWLTPVGRQLARLPLDPRLARMLVEANEQGALNELIVITAALTIVDPRERPREKQEAARQAHAAFADPDSDFLSWLKLWAFVNEERGARSANQFRKLCKQMFLNWLRIREWQDLCAQLHRVCADLGWTRNTTQASPEVVHRCVLSGLLSQIGQRDPNSGEYRGARNTRFVVAPGSAQHRGSAPWVMAGELVETNRLWARVVAPISPKAIERVADHLIVRSHADPRWDEDRGSSSISERLTLFGLTLVAARRIGLHRVDPDLARELFIRHALIEGEWTTRHDFDARNRAVLHEVKQLGDRVRRSLEFDDARLWRFFDERVPADVVTVTHFDRWWRTARRDNPELLTLTADVILGDDLLHDDATDEIAGADDAERSGVGRWSGGLIGGFPDTWQIGRLELPIRYEFSPGSENDGVTVEVPIEALEAVDSSALSWNVPGHRQELVDALIRSLPKQLRRLFVPAAETARSVRRMVAEDPLATRKDVTAVVAAALSRIAGTSIRVEDFRLDSLPAHLRVNYRVVQGTSGQESVEASAIAQGRDLHRLRAELVERQRAALVDVIVPDALPVGTFASWSFGSLPSVLRVASASGPVDAFPALAVVENAKSVLGDCIAVELCATRAEQYATHWEGMLVLVRNAAASALKSVDRGLGNRQRLALAGSVWGSLPAWTEDAMSAGVEHLMRRFVDKALVWDNEAFGALVSAVKDALPSVLQDLAKSSVMMSGSSRDIDAGLERIRALPDIAADVVAHRDRLLFPGCLRAVGVARVPDVLRYLVGIERRLERIPGRATQERAAILRMRALEDAYDRAVAAGGDPDVLEQAMWMLEELRLGTFAQTIGTRGTVSEKRFHTLLGTAHTAH